MYEQKHVPSDHSGYIGSPMTATETVRQAQVPAAVNGLEEAVVVAMKTVSELEVRLTPVLRNEPQAASNAPKDSPTAVPVASTLNEIAQRVRLLTETVASISRRLEV